MKSEQTYQKMEGYNMGPSWGSVLPATLDLTREGLGPGVDDSGQPCAKVCAAWVPGSSLPSESRRGDAGAKALAHALAQRPELTKLNLILWNCKIGQGPQRRGEPGESP